MSKVAKRIILIDGPRFAELMMDYSIRVTTVATLTIQGLDTDHLDEAQRRPRRGRQSRWPCGLEGGSRIVRYSARNFRKLRKRGDVQGLMAALWDTNNRKPFQTAQFQSMLEAGAMVNTENILNEFSNLGDDAFPRLMPYLCDSNWRKLAGYVLARSCTSAPPQAIAMSGHEDEQLQQAALRCLFSIAKLRGDAEAFREIRRQKKESPHDSVRMMALGMDADLDRWVQARILLDERASPQFPDPDERAEAIKRYMDGEMLKNSMAPWPHPVPPAPSGVSQ